MSHHEDGGSVIDWVARNKESAELRKARVDAVRTAINKIDKFDLLTEKEAAQLCEEIKAKVSSSHEDDDDGDYGDG